MAHHDLRKFGIRYANLAPKIGSSVKLYDLRNIGMQEGDTIEWFTADGEAAGVIVTTGHENLPQPTFCAEVSVTRVDRQLNA